MHYQRVEGECLPRICGSPGPCELERLVPRLDRISIVAPGDKKALAIAHPFAQIECSFGKFRRERGLAGIRVHRRQKCMRHREGGIQFDRALQVRDCFEARNLAALKERQRVRVKRVEGRRRRPGQGNVELLDRGERLAELLPQPRDRAAERAEHLLLRCGFGLLARHDITCLHVDGFEAEDVVLAEATIDRTATLQMLALRNSRASDRVMCLRPVPLHEAERFQCALVGYTFRNGDCSSDTASATFSVPSKTGSPVALSRNQPGRSCHVRSACRRSGRRASTNRR